MTRNFRLSYPNRREIFSRLNQTDPVTPKEQNKKKKKENSDEKFSAVLIGTDPSEREGKFSKKAFLD